MSTVTSATLLATHWRSFSFACNRHVISAPLAVHTSGDYRLSSTCKTDPTLVGPLHLSSYFTERKFHDTTAYGNHGGFWIVHGCCMNYLRRRTLKPLLFGCWFDLPPCCLGRRLLNLKAFIVRRQAHLRY